MDPWWTVAIVVTISIAVIGWLVLRINAQNQIISTQRDTIDTLNRQLDRQAIVGEVVEKVLNQLPKPREG